MSQLPLNFDGPIIELLTPDEIFANATEDLLKRLSEDRRIEFKNAKTEPRRLGDYLSMWANSKPGGGIMAIGIEKDGSVGGCSAISTAELNSREKAGKDFCPDARPEIKLLPARNAKGLDDFILLIRVPYREDKVVRTVSSNAYIRTGDEIRELSEDEIRELQIDKRELDFEREPVIDLVWPSDFESETITLFCESVRSKWKLDAGQTDEEILQHRRLGKFVNGVFVPNIACTLVFARDPLEKFPGCAIRFLRYDGDFEGTGANYNVEKDILIEGPIPKLIVEAARVVESQLRQFSGVGKDGKFYTIPEYPYSAWYEALVNACVHRSYGIKNRPIFVKMFTDKLVIESPGGFPPTVTPSNIYDVHHPRNPTIMNSLKYLDFVKCHNEGTRRMRDTMAEQKLPGPRFEQKNSEVGSYTVRVTLLNNIKVRRVLLDSSLNRIVSESLFASLSERERMVLNFVAVNRYINVSQCQRQLEMARWHTAKRFLMTMVKKKLLDYHKSSNIERGRSFFTLPKIQKGSI